MRKSYKLLKLLNSHGAVDKSTGLTLPRTNRKRTKKQRSYEEMLFSSDELEKVSDSLVDKGYLSASFYNDHSGSKLVITEQGIKFVTEYINKPRITRREIDIKNHKRVFIILGLLVVLTIYLISGCKITDGFSAVDCTKTLIQK